MWLKTKLPTGRSTPAALTHDASDQSPGATSPTGAPEASEPLGAAPFSPSSSNCDMSTSDSTITLYTRAGQVAQSCTPSSPFAKLSSPIPVHPWYSVSVRLCTRRGCQIAKFSSQCSPKSQSATKGPFDACSTSRIRIDPATSDNSNRLGRKVPKVSYGDDILQGVVVGLVQVPLVNGQQRASVC